LVAGNEKLLQFAKFVVEDLGRPGERQLVTAECTALQALAVNTVFRVCSQLNFATSVHTPDLFIDLLNLFSNPEVNVKVRSDAVGIVSLLCTENPADQRMFRKVGGLKAIMEYLQYDAEGPITRNANFRLALLDCVWNLIKNNNKNTLLFTLLDGIGIIMELLLRAPHLMKKLLLGLLSDTLEFRKVHEPFFSWSKGEHTALSVLLAEWTAEETRLGGIVEASFRSNHPNHRASRKSALTAKLEATLVYEDAGSDDEDSEQNNQSSAVFSRDTSFTYTNANNNTSSMNNSTNSSSSSSTLNDTLSSNKANNTLTSAVSGTDLRDTLFGIFSRIGFDSFPEQTNIQRAHLKFISRFLALKTSVEYQGMLDSFEREDDMPITRDCEFLMQKYVEGVEHVRVAAELKENWKSSVNELERDQLLAYIAQISDRKHQAGIDPVARKRFLALKNTRNHLLAKRARDEMLNKSLDKAATMRRTTVADTDDTDLYDADGDYDAVDDAIEKRLNEDLAAQGFTQEQQQQQTSSPAAQRTASHKALTVNEGGQFDDEEAYLNDVLQDAVSDRLFGL
jgi:hypothetical protein